MKELNRDEINDKYLLLAKQCDKRAMDIVVENNLALVGMTIKKYIKTDYEYDDIFQVGCIGLIKSIQNFDASFNVKFSTYAVPNIIGYIKRHIRDDRTIKISRSVQDLLSIVNYHSAKIREEFNRNPTLDELAIRCETTIEKISEAIGYSTCLCSLYDEMCGKDGTIILRIDKLDDKNQSENNIIKDIMLNTALNSLSKYDKRLIHLRYFEGVPQPKIAKLFNTSQASISRNEKKALLRMKELLIA